MQNLTLKEFTEGLVKYLDKHPKHADLPVVTARDDEGNGYNRVYYSPAHGKDWEVNGDEIEGVCVS
jgi:hypothetical protein